MLKIQRIPIPTWSHPVEVNIDQKFGEVEFQRIQVLMPEILLAIEAAIQQYLDDEPSNGQFPEPHRLTGEYYVSVECYSFQHEPWFEKVGKKAQYCFSFFARCLEQTWYPGQIDQDYLGLEIHYIWHPAEVRFEFAGVDSSSI
ncbi:MAG: hypothetical protein WBP13_08715 [Methylophilaceae bacterium]